MAKELPIYEIIAQDDETFAYDKISIVDKPAIMEEFYAFAQQSLPYKFEVDSEKQILAGPFMIPDLPIYRVDETGKEFFVQFSKETVAKLHYNFSRSNNNHAINIMHGSEMAEAFVIENWIIEDEKFDKSRKYGFKLPIGTSFGLVKIESKEFWDKEIKSGNLRGFSIEAMLATSEQPIGTLKMQKFMEYTLKDGTKIKVPAELVAGSDIMIVADDGTEQPAPSGEHMLEDGTTIIVDEGKVVEVKPKEEMADTETPPAPAEPGNMQMTPEMQAYVDEKINGVKAEFTEAMAAILEKLGEYESGKAEIDKVKKENEEMKAEFEKFSAIPGVQRLMKDDTDNKPKPSMFGEKLGAMEVIKRAQDLNKMINKQ